MSNYEEYPVPTDFRQELLDKLADLAMNGGTAQIDNVEVEVELEE